MDEKQLQALANELAKNLKTPEDLSQFDRLLKKLSVEAALNAEMTHHLGYEKNQSRPGANSRNGYSTKTVITGDGPLELRTPRDRNGTFEPQLVKKNRTRITGIDNQILSLYAKGMTTREIAAAFKELYDADVSPALISKVTDAVMEQVVEWQNRPLDAVYPIVYLDCIVLKVRQDSRYPQISRSWQANWPNLATFFAYPTDIRKVIYTTNAIESLNSVIRHAIKKRKVFPTDDSVKKVVWLAIQSASQKWTMPLKDWQMAMSRFIIEFGERLDSHF
ncbi:IS256 family transposase [Escherichia coli]|uniref:IS256 family transposase n=1 Tax=Escherichia coli TaxID=562 RepID=UPI0007E90CA2|nr:IS256 family transposase [Escherichia coli]MDY1736305.1 IS256 family transposase [Klebsiella pneumoniae]